MKYKDKENQILIFKFLKTNPLIPDYCKKNEYVWAVGKMTGGRFIPLMNFTDRKKSFIEGFSIKTTTKSIKSIGGELLFSGLASDGTQVARKMKLNADIGVVENVSYNRLIGLWALGAAAILASIMFIAIKARKKNIE